MSRVIKLKETSDTALSSSGVLVEASVVRLVNTGSSAQFIDVYDSTNTTRVGRHVINRYTAIYLAKDKDQYLRSGSGVRANIVTVEG